MLVIRLFCAAYGLGLTVLLLVPDPLAWLGIHRIAGGPPDIGTHFLLFATLGVLVAAGRFPMRRVPLAVTLIGYATAVELLQSLVPKRTVQLRDLAENLLGLAAGTTIWWLAQRHGRRPNSGGR